jgi:hypothetical protein
VGFGEKKNQIHKACREEALPFRTTASIQHPRGLSKKVKAESKSRSSLGKAGSTEESKNQKISNKIKQSKKIKQSNENSVPQRVWV